MTTAAIDRMPAVAATSPATRVPAAPRLSSIDALRGAVMVLMALDHVRDYFGVPGVDPTNASTASVALFFTRWVTNFCAPVFFLLTGAGAWFATGDVGDRSRWLAARGVWLLVLETVVTRVLGWQFNADYRVTLLLVLWALGWAMLTLAVLVRLRPAVSLVFGAVLIAGHNLLDAVRPETFGALSPLWLLLHQPGLLHPGPHFVIVGYPLIPWVGVAAVGYAMGQLYAWTPERRRALLFRLGTAATLLFLALRALNVYGDPRPWTAQATPVRTALSFLATTKYPPSLLYLLMTLGPALLVLAALDRGVPRWLRPAEVLGRVPLFYYVMHVPLIHLLAIAVCWQRYGTAHWMFESPTPDRFPVTPPPGWGYALPFVYLVWAIVVAMLWPLCRWYAALKRRRRDWWLRYL